jgi:hypothetical protein
LEFLSRRKLVPHAQSDEGIDPFERAVLNHEKRLTDSDEPHELSDQLTRKLVEVAHEGVIDFETLRERTLAEIMRS